MRKGGEEFGRWHSDGPDSPWWWQYAFMMGGGRGQAPTVEAVVDGVAATGLEVAMVVGTVVAIGGGDSAALSDSSSSKEGTGGDESKDGQEGDEGSSKDPKKAVKAEGKEGKGDGKPKLMKGRSIVREDEPAFSSCKRFRC